MTSASSLHLTLGDHAAGLLREACQSHNLSGAVFSIPDDLTHGPLDNGPARLAYFKACYRGFADWTFTSTDAFAPWQELLANLDRAQPTEIVIWAGDNVSEATFLPMTCAWLDGRGDIVSHVVLPSGTYTGQLTLAQLASLFRSRSTLTQAERTALAEDFARIRDQTGFFRRWEHGRIIGVPMERYDDLLLRACPTDWTSSVHLIGTAMAACEPANRMSDLFLTIRLRALIEAGHIEADLSAPGLGQYAIRLMPNLDPVPRSHSTVPP